MSDAVGDLAALGFGDRVAALLGSLGAGDGDARAARVVRAEKGHVRLATDDGELLLAVPPDLADGGPAVVGDWVVVAPNVEGDDEVVGVAPRWSELVRHDPDERRPQVLAANVDLVALVHGMDRPFKPGRLERFLAAAWESGAEPVVVVTKADLADGGGLDAVLAEIAAAAPGVDVVVTSTEGDRGVADFASLLRPDRTGVLLGESGAGKSSLANALLGEHRLTTGEVRGGDFKGRHTTTTREMVPMPGGGVLIDTPGVRAFAPWDAADGLRQVFSEIDELADGCRFRDCRHDAEPGCAVKAALEAGDLDVDRFERYQALLAEQAAFVERRDESARRGGKRR